jgi:hypothetical protein
MTMSKQETAWRKKEADVRRLAKRLMKHFEGRHHRFLVDYGWEQVARVALTKPRARKTRKS